MKKRTVIFTYGLTAEEEKILHKSLPSKETEVVDITGRAGDVVTRHNFAVIINPDNIVDDELEFLASVHQHADLTETFIFTGKRDNINALFEGTAVIFNDPGELGHNLKYELLQAKQRTNKADGFSNSLAHAITILFAIRNEPYITTKALAEKIERTPRTVQRYIETLRCAGEWIEYDTGKKGWYLLDGKSILLDEI